MPRRPLAVAVASLVALLALGGCGEDAEPTRFQEALAQAAGSPHTGVGWVDLAALRGELTGPERVEALAGALGPTADDVLEGAGATERLTGVDPLAADEAFSLTGSYAFGVRLNGVDPSRFERELRAQGGPAGTLDGWTTFDLAEESRVPAGFEPRPIGRLAARVAVRDTGLILSRWDDRRAQLIGAGTPLDEHPLLSFAAGCLEDVAAGRIQSPIHLISSHLGFDLIAAGMPVPSRERGREVFCIVSDPGESLADPRDRLEESLRPEAEDVVSDAPVRDLIADASFESLSEDGGEAVRVELELRDETPPGFVFRSLSTGQMASYLGVKAPFEVGEG